MNLFGHDWSFWVALVGAALIRVATSPFHSLPRAAIMVATSVFVAWVSTDAAVDFLKLDPLIYKAPVGAVLALSADGIIRLFFTFWEDPEKVLEMWKKFRGGGAK